MRPKKIESRKAAALVGLVDTHKHPGFYALQAWGWDSMGIIKEFSAKKTKETGFHLYFTTIMLSVILTRDNKRAMVRNQESSSKTISMTCSQILLLKI